MQIPLDATDPFICPRCGHGNGEFCTVRSECGRPLIRDYFDWRMYPRDPELQGTSYYSPFRARIWLALPGFLFNFWHLFVDTGVFPKNGEKPVTHGRCS